MSQRLLLADDQKAVLDGLESFFRANGFDVDCARDGREALSSLRSHKVDLIIADIMMPTMDGFQLCREVKSNEALRNIPFVFYTASYVSPEDEAFAKRLGADAFLAKPVRPLKLLEQVREILVRTTASSEPASLPEDSSVPYETVDFLTEYNGRLVQKLEHKVDQLEEANRRLSAAHARFEALAQKSPVGVFELGARGELTFCNDRWLEITGLNRKKATANAWLERLDAENRASVYAQWCEAIINRRSLQLEFRLLRGAEFRWVIAQLACIQTEETGASGFIGAFIDVTWQKQLEYEREQIHARWMQSTKTESLGRLVSGMSHDFNNLLGAIVGYAQQAQANLKSGKPATQEINQLMGVAERAKTVTRQLLWYSRPESDGNRKLQLRPLIEETLQLFMPSIPNGITLLDRLDGPLPSIVGDPAQIHQMLLSLLTNAVQAMGNQAGSITVTLEKNELEQSIETRIGVLPAGVYLALRVSDTGCGIEPAILPQIFEPFFTTKSIEEGTGMGLSLVKGIVRDHRGGILLDSTLGKGTSFTVLFPIPR